MRDVKATNFTARPTVARRTEDHAVVSILSYSRECSSFLNLEQLSFASWDGVDTLGNRLGHLVDVSIGAVKDYCNLNHLDREEEERLELITDLIEKKKKIGTVGSYR
jgi:hypothetical protein